MSDVDKNDDENKADLIVSLMQKDSRLKRLQTRQDSCEEYIQFKLFKVFKLNFEKLLRAKFRVYNNTFIKGGTG